MRLVTVVLILLLALIQYPLWWGHGGWLRVHELQQQLGQQTDKNTTLRLRNERVQGEVQDLQNGTSAVEERARYEMGMVKDSEVFVQFVSPNSTAPVNSANVPGMSGSTRGQVSSAPLRVVPNPVSRSKQELRDLDRKAQKDKAADAKKKQGGAQ
ncbi:cell division protein FtsB [Caballeronia sp. LZ035]|uniref:cell division protein FtsB n=1 Tax=Caballeronia sp. LZ035 TaxID=3038568 RepID=UPI0028597D42|nr:cell division protein FtsB [Caballeronia sp. LZ035]MDR5757510.1 cell division protein FtsB [Caballeronia sp. LZ035]